MKVKVNNEWVDVPAFKVETGMPLEDVKKMLSGGDIGELVIPEGITELRPYAFYSMNSSASAAGFTLSLPSTLQKLGSECFSRSKIVGTLYIPSNIKTFSGNDFSRCLIESVVYDTSTAPSSYMFAYMQTLKTIVFKKAITGFGNYAFGQCTSLEEVDLSHCTRVPTLSYTITFASVPTSCTIKVPASLYDAWITATNWSILYSQGYNFVAV